ncbi:hypothetical protein ACIGGE_10560 [Qipengyuania sp. NPDC077410]|uniref:hypothetical protein n=1 Tax=Qipengyuania sp. NPDC077410 TaxID=3364496 RepID=UPI0037C55D40
MKKQHHTYGKLVLDVPAERREEIETWAAQMESDNPELHDAVIEADKALFELLMSIRTGEIPNPWEEWTDKPVRSFECDSAVSCHKDDLPQDIKDRLHARKEELRAANPFKDMPDEGLSDEFLNHPDSR